ncbi:hypothetical protein, partial [Shinella zoogloeoides]|uniref:hypothetical protein n=1 Tax=Shinella zoogloeoides TaxID=352475 RepID=UPI00360C8082
PVSMDAIQEINIDLANYDTTIYGGTGAVINAVTKSGTNEFHGTVYGSYRNRDDMVRRRLDTDKGDFNGFNDEKTYGMTFGGPIVKDKLFFFANYEKYERSAPGVALGDTPYGKGNINDADIKSVQDFMTGKGYDVGSLSAPDSKTEIEEYAVKLDWNINDNNLLEATWSQQNNHYSGSYYDYDLDAFTEGGRLDTVPTPIQKDTDYRILKYTSYLTDSLTLDATYGTSDFT